MICGSAISGIAVWRFFGSKRDLERIVVAGELDLELMFDDIRSTCTTRIIKGSTGIKEFERDEVQKRSRPGS